ncbi:transmembrane protein 217 [Monodelphis domestica]|uniref:transmembrane protein 217 n=1 Tax=Monodelphis domestica TaxID=13616 RepID=UPI0024E1B9BE|nr:transmembrane protein 217 [Monodelphis domestica]
MRTQRYCGMTAQLGTFLSGVFTIFTTNMFVVFEERHMGDPNCTIQIAEEVNLLNKVIICWSFKITFGMSMVTILISCLLLYSVRAQIYQGMVVYVIWIIFFEAVNSLLQTLTNTAGEGKMNPVEVRYLRWFGLISRVFMHGFWIFFVLKYAHIVYKKQMENKIASYNRPFSSYVELIPDQQTAAYCHKLSYPSEDYLD